MFAAGALGAGFWIAIWIIIGCLAFFAGLFYWGIFVVGPNSPRAKEIARAREAASKQAAIARQQLKAEYSKKYEERKITIGIIKCSQCEWSGEWGTGMSYEQFFAGDLAEHEIHVGRSKGEKSSLSLNNRQYECPVCNSLSWQKV